ncbi:MAG: phytanoyl-CoA dioxygenase family protein [Chitinophagales bacterium]
MVTEKQLVNSPSFTNQDKLEYQNKGVIHIEDMLPFNTVRHLQASAEANFKSDDQPDGVIREFDRFSNEFANRDEFFKVLAQDILAPLNKLTNDELVVTQIAILELEVGKGKGFDWHFDEYSFSFIDINSPGHTLWVPLNPIDVNKQRGGMVWVHQDDFSGKGRLKQWTHYQLADKELKIMPNGHYSKSKYEQYYNDNWAGPYDKVMLDDLQQECSLKLGDALLFNRNTWHKSQELLPNGPLTKRTTIIFRLVSLDAKIHRTLFEKTIERMKLEGNVPPKSFGHRLGAFKDGDSIRDAINSGISF